MADDAGLATPVNFTLSRHEVLVVLDALGADVIPGLGPDPLGDLTPEQNQLALIIAQRALEARGFIEIRENRPTFHQWVLDGVGACALASKALMILHRTPEHAPRQFFTHFDDTVTALHVRNSDVLHTFSLMPSRDYLIDRIVDITGLGDETSSQGEVFSISRDVFIQAREAAEGGEVASAVQIMQSIGAPDEIQTFAETLANSPMLTVFQFLNAKDADNVGQKDFSLLHDDARAWFLEAEDDVLHIQAISATAFRIYLEKLLSD